MPDKIDITITVPLAELVKVIKMIYAFGKILDDIDDCFLDTELAYIASEANKAYGDEVEMLEGVPLVTQFSEAYFGILMEDD